MRKQILFKLIAFFILNFCSFKNYAANEFFKKSYSYSITPPDSLVIIAPNVFTPNGDGTNDYWSIIVHDFGVAMIDLQATVYDRWGKIIFNTTNVRQVWNGHNLIGKACEEGTYYFVVSYVNGTTLEQETV